MLQKVPKFTIKNEYNECKNLRKKALFCQPQEAFSQYTFVIG